MRRGNVLDSFYQAAARQEALARAAAVGIDWTEAVSFHGEVVEGEDR